MWAAELTWDFINSLPPLVVTVLVFVAFKGFFIFLTEMVTAKPVLDKF